MNIINNFEFAKEHSVLSGFLDVSKSDRLLDIVSNGSGLLDFKLTGFHDQKNRLSIEIEICGIIMTVCQFCLKNLEMSINHSWVVVIVKNEQEQIKTLFQEEDYADAIIADAKFDVINFIEDEIIMQLPIAPKHEQCELA